MRKQNLIPFILLAMAACKPSSEQELATLKKDKVEIETKLVELSNKIKALEKKTGKTTAVIQKTAFVQFQKVEPVTFKHFIEVQGKITTNQNLTVSPKTQGEILQIHVVKGQAVKKGMLLANIEVVSLQKAKDELQTGLAFATEVFEKQKSLWEQKIGSEIQYLQAKNNKESLEQKLASLNVQIAMGSVKAPADGTIDEIYPKLGELIAPGMPMFRLIGKGDFKITTDISESYASKVKVGNTAEITFPDLKKTVNSYVKVVGDEVNALNRTFNVELAMPSASSYTKANMIAYIKIKDYEKKQAITVPVSVIQKSPEGEFVFVDINGVASKKLISVGQTSQGQAEILKGLAFGDKVITTGFMDLTEGQPLKY